MRPTAGLLEVLAPKDKRLHFLRLRSRRSSSQKRHFFSCSGSGRLRNKIGRELAAQFKGFQFWINRSECR